MNTEQAVLADRTEQVTFYPRASDGYRTGLFVWRGDFGDRALAEAAGYKWSPLHHEYATSDPAIAYRLAPRLAALEPFRKRLALSYAEDSAFEVPLPEGRQLHPYQRAGIEYMHDVPVAYLADEPGLGKTAQAIGVANVRGALNVLVICPAHLRINWTREVAMWATGEPYTQIYRKLGDSLIRQIARPTWTVVSYEAATKYTEKLRAFGPYDLMILDEAHALKGPRAKRSKKILGTRYDEPLTRAAKQVIFLSGTPAPNRAAEMWTILRAAAPHIIADCKTLEEFADRFSYFFRDEFDYRIKGSRNETELGLRLRSGFMCRRLKEDVLKQLPPKIFKLVVFDPDSNTRKLLDRERPFNAREIINNGVPAGSPLADVRREMGLAKVPLVLEYVRGLLDGGVKKVLVFGWHREVIQLLTEGLAAYGAVSVLGGLNDTKRQGAVDAFQNDSRCRVFVGNLQAAGTGLTLTSSSHVVLAEGSWVPGENDQAVDRCHRMGQTALGVYVHLLVVEGSLDAAILGCAAGKAHDTGKVLNSKL
jgi:SWI/SNF-related matrix-associated actin-dependent regulator 1 of chromatin subfamily A